MTLTVTDYHTGGEPFRIVTGGAPPLRGATVLERRRHAVGLDQKNFQTLGHAVRRVVVADQRDA